ncbi:Lipase maturation factor 2, partial [Phytophthora palmivora]
MLIFPRDFFLICICRPNTKDGIESVDTFLRSVKHRYVSELHDASTFEWIVHKVPTLVWLHEPLQWTPSFCMEVICLVGVTAAVLGVIQPAWRSLPRARSTATQTSSRAYAARISSVTDELTLSGLLAPWWHHSRSDETFETPAAVVWTLRFLFFKFMLMSGAVKIQSRCPTWLGLTALDFHFASQPLPLPLSWYASQVPPIINSIAVAVTLLIEGPWTFFLLAPHRMLRRIGAIQQITLQISIILTGNYNFFNLLTIILATALIDIERDATNSKYYDNESQKSWITRVESAWYTFQIHPVATKALLMCGLWFCVYTWLEAFEITILDDPFTAEQRQNFIEVLLATRIQLLLTVEDTQTWLALILPRCTVFSAVLVVCSSCWQIMHSFSPSRHSGMPTFRSRSRLALRLIYLLTTTVASIWIFTSSVATLSVLDQSFQQSLPSFVFSTYSLTEKYSITSAYGLFRRMTGVGTVQLDNGQRFSVVARPEIILEGTDDGGLTWKAYHFKYKPGDVTSAPRLVAPFHPRLDWQMWFAALGDYHGAPWLVHLVAKLLKGSPDVKDLLDTTHDPFPDTPPDAIRAQLYYYDFTRLNASWNRALPRAKILGNNSDPQWWTRTYVREYLPALERGNPSLAAFVEQYWPESPSVPKRVLETSLLRRWIDQVLESLCNEPWSPVGIAASFVLVKSVLFRRHADSKL